ncbi:MAG: hypothetical protein QM730_02540 [Anaerolineales bacterium]
MTALTHSLEEQYQKQIIGIEDFDIAHEIAISAEVAVAGIVQRVDDYNFGTNIYSIQYEYSDPTGCWYYTDIDLVTGAISKHGCNPGNK